jgi:hypothetical protein
MIILACYKFNTLIVEKGQDISIEHDLSLGSRGRKSNMIQGPIYLGSQ